jgi:hypothetical protein
MTKEFIPRALSYKDATGSSVELSQDGLADFEQPLLILGEAGMGKSSLLNWLAQTFGFALCTARQFINRRDPRSLLGDSPALLIDGLDEVSAAKDGDAVDLVLRQLGALDYPRFVLACRVADWRSATGSEAIREQYSQPPLELHIEPLTEAQAEELIARKFGSQRACEVIEHFNRRGLQGLLSNPQTLELILQVVAGGDLPENRRDLFELAIKQVASEHKDTKADKQEALKVHLEAAGAAFAALLLSGNEAITRKALAQVSDGELPLADVLRLPGGERVPTLLDSRLFRGLGQERFGYVHRSIAEYLGARWLARLANTPRKRRRLLHLFHAIGLVPASLRGLHAWLAQDPEMASCVVATDPLGLIEYGDANGLSDAQVNTLLSGLRQLAQENPNIHNWRDLAAHGLARPTLIEEFRALVSQRDAPFGPRLVGIQALFQTNLAQALQPALLALVLNPADFFALRRVAVEVLNGSSPAPDWPDIARRLLNKGEEDSIRLALEMIQEVGYEAFDNGLIVKLALIHASQPQRTIGCFYVLARALPDAQLDGFLDELSHAFAEIAGPASDDRDSELTDLAYYLIVRRLMLKTVEAEAFWRWLQPFSEACGYERDTRNSLTEFLKNNTELRRAVQKRVLLGCTGGQMLWQLESELYERSVGFRCTPSDVIALLAYLNPNDHTDERWRDLIQFVPHNQECGAEVRASAKPFAAHSSDLQRWIDKLAFPSIPDWKIQEEERQRTWQDKRAKEHVWRCEHYAMHMAKLRGGDFEFICDPASVYLNRSKGDGTDEDLTGPELVAKWLNPELVQVVLEGFEAFLKQDPLFPSAEQIALSHSENRYYPAGFILVAALAERDRTGRGFSDVNDERLMAAVSVLRFWGVGRQGRNSALKQQIEGELQRRGCWRRTLKISYEPSLRVTREHISGLSELMRDEQQESVASELAIEWLKGFENLSQSIETELIDRLLKSMRYSELKEISESRFATLTDSRRLLTWNAVSLIVDFDRSARRIDHSKIDSDLLFEIRDRTTRARRPMNEIPIASLKWVIETFRTTWPMTETPRNCWSGYTNPWDACKYICELVNSLGNNVSQEARTALSVLRDAAPDSYTDMLKGACAEQKRLCVETNYRPPALDAIAAIAGDSPPACIEDLQNWVLEELLIVQSKVRRGDDAESWRGFSDNNNVPYPEERCRDHLLGLLRQGTPGVAFEPEAHVAANKEVDIACVAGTLRLPVEIKGQWHAQLWSGADRQLDELYTTDWRAEKRGIYLVLWFGSSVPRAKKITSPGREVGRPDTPEQLRSMLIKRSQSALEGRVSVVVLDLTQESALESSGCRASLDYSK